MPRPCPPWGRRRHHICVQRGLPEHLASHWLEHPRTKLVRRPRLLYATAFIDRLCQESDYRLREMGAPFLSSATIAGRGKANAANQALWHHGLQTATVSLLLQPSHFQQSKRPAFLLPPRRGGSLPRLGVVPSPVSCLCRVGIIELGQAHAPALPIQSPAEEESSQARYDAFPR
jgi:hypothetical protein